MSNRTRSVLVRLALLVAAAAIMPACGGGGGSGSASPGGGLTYTSRGGTGLAGDGGNGGRFELYAYSGNDVYVLPTGSVNATGTLPASIMPYLGTNPEIVSANTTWNVGGELMLGSTTVSNGSPVTGVWVKPGVALTIKPNFDDIGGDGLRDTVRAYLANSWYIEGAIVIDFQDRLAAGDGASNNCSRFVPGGEDLVVRPGGSILVEGRDVVGDTGGYGGLYDDSIVWATIVNQGTISTKGGNGDTGGNGGEIYVGYRDTYGTYNTGLITSDGGTGTAGQGGYAGQVYFWEGGGYGPLMNSGTVSAAGGDGTDGGGNGGYMNLYTYYGIILNSGTFTTAGGNATDAASNADGGTGGDFYLYSCGGVRIAGSITTAGGNGVGTGDGGNGGYIQMYGDYDYDLGDNGATTLGMYFGCNVDTSGGDGEYGGDAGPTYYYRYSRGYCQPGKQPVYFVGYAAIDVSGGDGEINGGDAGGDNSLLADSDYDQSYTYYQGSLIVASNIIARGGNGATGYAGRGRRVDLRTGNGAYTTQGSDYGVFNSGVIDTSGGDGDTDGGDAGSVHIYGRYKAVNSGTLIANGGEGNTADGGWGGAIEIYSSLDVVNTANLSAVGGGTVLGDGGGWGYIALGGLSVTASGAYNVNGGNGGTGAGDWGGDAGDIDIVSQNNSTAWGASVSLIGGTGTNPGSDGDFWLDGIHVSGQ